MQNFHQFTIFRQIEKTEENEQSEGKSPCENKGIGCYFTGSQSEIKEHKNKNCVFRKVSCPVHDCFKKIYAKGIVEHLKNAHNVTVKDGDEIEAFEPLKQHLDHDKHKQWKIKAIQFDHKRFIKVFEKNKQNWHHLFVYIQGSQSMADFYKVVLQH